MHHLMRKVYLKKQDVAEEKEEDPIHSSPQDAAADKLDEPARATGSSASGDESVVAKEGMEEKSPTKSPLPPSPTQTAQYELDKEEAFAGRGLPNDDKVVCVCVSRAHQQRNLPLHGDNTGYAVPQVFRTQHKESEADVRLHPPQDEEASTPQRHRG